VKTHEGKRLREWRESLPGEVSRRSMCVALDWEDTRWWQFEQKERWSQRQREELRTGLASLLARTDASEDGRAGWIAYLLGGAAAPPAEPIRWLPGQCPALPMGRPTGRRYRGSARAAVPHDSERPVLPAEVRREATAAVLRMLAGGSLNVEAAERAIFDIFAPLDAYYNKMPDPDSNVA
jgi:hypothetical protein